MGGRLPFGLYLFCVQKPMTGREAFKRKAEKNPSAPIARRSSDWMQGCKRRRAICKTAGNYSNHQNFGFISLKKNKNAH